MQLFLGRVFRYVKKLNLLCIKPQYLSVQNVCEREKWFTNKLSLTHILRILCKRIPSF